MGGGEVMTTPNRLAVMVAGVLVACYNPPREPTDVARAQAELAPDTAQSRLWGQAAGSGAAIKSQLSYADTGMVRTRSPVVVRERPAESREVAFPDTVSTAAAILSVPQLERPFNGQAIVKAVDGEFLTLELENDQRLRLQVKVRGDPLHTRVGERARIYFQYSGDLFARKAVLALELRDDTFVYAFVNVTNRPVRFELLVPAFSLRQIGEPSDGGMGVRVSVLSETLELQPGEEGQLRSANLTVKLLVSRAIVNEEDHDYVIEGAPYRVSLLAWRTRVREPPEVSLFGNAPGD
jgi:hypothetical protein